MSVLRQLSLVYLAGASVFAVAIGLDRNPGIGHAIRLGISETAQITARQVVRPIVTIADRWAPHRVKALPVPRVVIAIAPPPPARWIIPIEPPPANLTPGVPGIAPVQLERVATRLQANISPEMLANFRLFLYVSTAAHGPWAQRLYVFAKNDDGKLSMIHNWPASTGRDVVETAEDGSRQESFTLEGYFELDPHRMFRNHISGQWHASMPFSMFFDWEHGGRQTGVAIHSITGGEARLLGHRASHGCIRLGRENAELLFNLIHAEYKGDVPRLAFDDSTDTTTRDGTLMRDSAGNLVMKNGYKVLVFVENYGGKDVVATLF
jgi:L,D-transpeptidase catalytic domain